jgi:hypothetical protein
MDRRSGAVVAGSSVLPVVLLLSLLGCGRSPVYCPAYVGAGLSVQVTNAATGQPICDATVVASEGSYSEGLFENACQFTGAYGRPGTYVVSASRAGFVSPRTASARVIMGGGDCPQVVMVRLKIELTPER